MTTPVPTSIRIRRSAPILVLAGVLIVAVAYGWTGLVGWLGQGRAPRPLVLALMHFGSAALALVLYGLFTRYVERRREREELRWRDAPAMLARGLVIGALFMSAVVGLIAASGGYHVDGLHGIDVIWFPLTISVWTGIVEELLFRGVVFRVIERRRGSWFALSFSAALFGAVHLMNPNADLLSALAIALEAGLMLGACYMAFRTLWVPIGVHIAWNFMQGGVYGIAVSGWGMQGLLASSVSGPSWMTGGAFGAEASVYAVAIGLVVFAYFVVRARRLGRIVSHADARAVTARELDEATATRRGDSGQVGPIETL